MAEERNIVNVQKFGKWGENIDKVVVKVEYILRTHVNCTSMWLRVITVIWVQYDPSSNDGIEGV